MAIAIGTKKTEGTISLTRATQPTYSSPHTDELAAKYNIALGENSPGEGAVRASIVEGNTKRLEEILGQQQQIDRAKTRNELIQQIAVQSQGNPTELDLEIVRGLSMEQLEAPNLGAILEEEYAKKVTDTSAVLLDEEYGVLGEAMQESPDQALEVMDRVQNIATRNMVAANLYDEVQRKFDTANLIDKGKAFLQQVVPFRSWYELNNFVKSAPVNRLNLPGETIEQQIAYLYTLPPADFKKELELGIKTALTSANYLDALTFLEAVQSFSENDSMMNDVFAGLDIATTVPLGALVRGVGKATRVVNGSTKSLVASASELNLNARAVKGAFQEALQEGVLPSMQIKKITDAEKTVPSIFRPTEAFSNGVKSVDGPALARLERAAIARGEKAIEILTDVNRVERLTPQALELAFEQAEETLRTTFTHQNHQVIDVSRNAAEDNIGNVYSVTVALGQKNGNPFRSKKAAENFAKFVELKTNDFEITPRGSGWTVNVTRNVDETNGGVRNVEIATNAKTPDTFDNRFLGAVYGADKKLPKDHTTARGVATLSAEHMSQLMDEFSKPFAALAKGERRDLEKFLAISRDNVNKKGERGISYHTVSDFEDAFAAKIGRSPTYAEIDAYQAFKQAYDLDWIIRDLDVFKQKAVMGVESFSFKFGGVDTTLEGKVVSELPRGSQTPFTVGVVNGGKYVGRTTGSKYPTFRSNMMRQEDWDLIQSYLDDGYQIIQAYEGHANLGDVFTNFIITREFKRDRVGLMNLNYAQGSRVIQKYPNYVKQGKVEIDSGIARYKGDVGVANARSLDEANVIANHMEQVRLLMREGKADEALTYIKDNLPQHDAAHVVKQFTDGTFSTNVPFRALQAGARSIDNFDMVGALRNNGQSVNQFITADEFDLSRQVQGKFLGERDAVNMQTYKVENGVVLRHDGDNLMSPFDTLRLSMSDMINTHVIHDYRLKSTWDYTKEFGDLLDGTEADFMTNGLNFIFNPKYKTGVDANRVKIAENVRKSILGLFNNKTIVDRQLDTYKEKLTTSMRNILGDNTGEWVSDKAIHTLENGDKWMRAAAFHSKMGFFNVKQLFLQSSAAVNILSITPTHGARGARAYFALRNSVFAPNEKVLRTLANKQTISGFSKDEFLEMSSAYRRSGFAHVGNDVAYLDDLMPPNLVKGKFSQVLDFGATFFKEGERVARTMAFAAAYSERKAMLKGGALKRADEAAILQRAKDLTGNMTRDSNAGWQKGYGAVATQFMGFQMRLMEQFIGTKLTLGEKARLFTGMSLMYGVPVASGMTMGVVPIRDMLKDWLAKEGVEYDDTLAEPFMDGFATTILEMASGMDLNLSERYGPGGITSFYDLLKGDSELSDILLGASGGIIWDTMQDADPLLKGMSASFDFNDETVFPIVISDLVEPLRNISTINNAIKLQEGIQTGRWVSQNENQLTNVELNEAIVSSIFGLDPERVSDTFNQLSAVQGWKDHQTSVRNEAIIDLRRGIQAMRDANFEDSKRFFSRAKAAAIRAGFTVNQMSSMYRDAWDRTPMDESVGENYTKYIQSLNNDGGQ
jgi:hypothetical protein